MEFLTELWVPIVVSGVFVFVVSALLHMVIPLHKGEYKLLPGEAAIEAAIRAQGVPRGEYAFPRPNSMKDMASPEMVARYNAGPVGMLTILPLGAPKMGKSLLQWFLFSLLIGVFVAYLTRLALGPGAPYHTVFRISGTVAVLGYAIPYLQDSIWKGRSWKTSLTYVFDGVIYGLLTAGVFGWLWPNA